jgi:hypothetical protein
VPDPIRAGDPPTPLPSEVLAGQGVAAFVLRPADLDRLASGSALETVAPPPVRPNLRRVRVAERIATSIEDLVLGERIGDDAGEAPTRPPTRTSPPTGRRAGTERRTFAGSGPPAGGGEEQADALRAEVARLTGLLDDASAEADRADRAERDLAACRAEVVSLGQTLDRIVEQRSGRRTEDPAVTARHLAIPETFLPTPEHPAALRVSGPGLVEYDGHELRIEYDDEEPARPGLAPDPTIDDPTVIPLRHRQHPTPDAWPDNAITVTYRELRRLVHLHLTVAVAGMPREKPWEWIKARARAVDDGEAPLLLSEVLDR